VGVARHSIPTPAAAEPMLLRPIPQNIALSMYSVTNFCKKIFFGEGTGTALEADNVFDARNWRTT
jgi:hypothetical protein